MAGAAFVTDDSLVAELSSPAAMYKSAQADGTALVTVTNDGKFALEYDRCDSLFYVQLIEQADMISMNQAPSEVLASLSDSDRAMVSAFVELGKSSTHEDERQSEKGEGRLHQADVIGLSDGYGGSVKTPKAGFRWPGSSESGPDPGSASGTRGRVYTAEEGLGGGSVPSTQLS